MEKLIIFDWIELSILGNILRRIQMVINTPVGGKGKHDDSYIRKTAIQHKIPYITTTAAAMATVAGIATVKSGNVEVKSIQEYHR